jgi:hypothetical protein
MKMIRKITTRVQRNMKAPEAVIPNQMEMIARKRTMFLLRNPRGHPLHILLVHQRVDLPCHPMAPLDTCPCMAITCIRPMADIPPTMEVILPMVDIHPILLI